MTDTLLNKISEKTITNAWLIGRTGEIVDLLGNNEFRFIDYIDSPKLRLKHITEESKLSCPVVACGFVGYWLHNKDSKGTKAIFEGYYALRLTEYEKAHESDDDAWKRDFKKEFVCRYHIPNEKKLIKASEALFAYITDSDQKIIKNIANNYLKFARTKRKELYPPNHLANRMIEDTFLDAYRMGGPAYECMSWMRTEYNLPYMGPHWHKGGKTEKEQLSDRWKEHHEKVIPEYVAEEYEDFNDGVLMYTNGGLMDEIDENIKKCQTQEDRIRYIISLLQPFKEFADAFDAKARIDERKRSIVEHEKWIKDWSSIPDDAVDERTGEPLRPKDQISACEETIEKYNEDIEYWKKVQEDFYWFAQHGLGAGHYREYPQEVNDDMCKFLGGWWECMIHFARKLASLALTYGIKLMDVQERCEVYLTWRFIITDYVDNKYITSTEHARKLLNEIEAKKPKSEVNSKVGSSVIKKEADKTKTKAKPVKKPGGKPMTLKYYKYGNKGELKRQRRRVHQVFKMWNRWGWIDEQTTIDDFDAFFEGEPRHCNITWTGSNTTILTIMLQELLKQSYFEEQTGCAAKSLVEQQFGKTANSDRTRLDNISDKRINLTLLVLDPNNHDLIFQRSDNLSEIQDIQDAALMEIFAGQLHSTKGI